MESKNEEIKIDNKIQIENERLKDDEEEDIKMV
jgi:hypothetical protein